MTWGIVVFGDQEKCSSLLSFLWSSPIITHCRQLCVAFAAWWLLNNWSWDVKYFPNELKVQSKSCPAATIVRHFNVSARDGWELFCLQKHVSDSLGAEEKQQKKTRMKKKRISFCNKRTLVFKLWLLSLRFRNSALQWLIQNVSNSFQI